MEILINELADLQEKFGYIPEEEIERISKEKGIQKAQLYGIISFYTRIYTQKKGENIIRVCKSVSCGMNGSKQVRDAIIKYLKLDDSRTSKDGKFTFELVECLGLCNLAPAMTINNEIYENLTPNKAIEIIKSYE